VADLIASSTAEYEALQALAAEATTDRFRFGQPTSTQAVATTSATTTKRFRDVELSEIGGEVVATWRGEADQIPYYYCVLYSGPAATALGYGSHVMADLALELGTTTDLMDKTLYDTRLCRNSIRVDRIGQSVQYFNFLPNSEHHVVMQLQDGVYVVEIDDRSWQNVQLLYPGDYLEMIVENGSIYIKDGEYIFEVLTETI
jgi:hypothetical protein